MWPFKTGSTREYVRLGAHSVERWTTSGEVMSCEAVQVLTPGIDPSQQLAGALAAIFSSGAKSKVTLLLESALLPVMLIDTGSSILKDTQLDALVRHRFGLVYGDSQHAGADWAWRVEHRPGERYALVYAQAPVLKAALTAAARSARIDWAAWLPAFSWGLERVRSAGPRLAPTGWWLWQEQDRTLVARFAAHRLVGLNPGAAPVDSSADVVNLVEADAARLGVRPKDGSIVAAKWSAIDHTMRNDPVVEWRSVESGFARVRLAASKATVAGMLA